MRKMRRKKKGKAPFIGALMIVGLLSTGAMAFTASNSVPTSKSGQGSGAVSGYAASSVHYSLNSTDPRTIDSVTFTLDSTPASGSTIKVQVATGGTWFTCSATGTSVTCPSSGTMGVAVSTADNLSVVVAQ